MGPLLAQANDIEPEGLELIGGVFGLIGGLLGLIISIFLAYKCARNGRWVLFVLGFFCAILWIVGWAMGPRRDGPRY